MNITTRVSFVIFCTMFLITTSACSSYAKYNATVKDRRLVLVTDSENENVTRDFNKGSGITTSDILSSGVLSCVTYIFITTVFYMLSAYVAGTNLYNPIPFTLSYVSNLIPFGLLFWFDLKSTKLCNKIIEKDARNLTKKNINRVKGIMESEFHKREESKEREMGTLEENIYEANNRNIKRNIIKEQLGNVESNIKKAKSQSADALSHYSNWIKHDYWLPWIISTNILGFLVPLLYCAFV